MRSPSRWKAHPRSVRFTVANNTVETLTLTEGYDGLIVWTDDSTGFSLALKMDNVPSVNPVTPATIAASAAAAAERTEFIRWISQTPQIIACASMSNVIELIHQAGAARNLFIEFGRLSENA